MADLKCIRGGDESAINAALSRPNAKVALCPKALFHLHGSIILSADSQELFTLGSPSGDSQARLFIDNARVSTAIYSHASNIRVHHLTIDGAREQLGRDPKGGALIEVGGDVSGVIIDNVRARNPRGWSIIHVFEGSGKCEKAQIIDNELGPAGRPDGQWADGVSLACRNSLVARNIITDASDGGIVIFGAPGTVVEHNVIKTVSNTLLGGINLVDYKPFDGDYTGTIVRNNEILAEGGFIKVGIAVGPSVWTDDTQLINRGGAVEDNTLRGDHFGYGIAVQGVQDFTVRNNKAEGHFVGVHGPRCHPQTLPAGGAFVRNSAMSTGHFEDGFTEGVLTYSICIQQVP